MSYPKRAPELRTIKVRNTKFRWRFFQNSENPVLRAYGMTSGCQPLIVTFPDCYEDSWTVFSIVKKMEPVIIGPDFARQVIEFGLDNGWSPDQVRKPLCISYDGGNFSLIDN
jgi:hypothetical protein